jgi:hypothetical protein
LAFCLVAVTVAAPRAPRRALANSQQELPAAFDLAVALSSDGLGWRGCRFLVQVFWQQLAAGSTGGCQQ